jgi:hypothetical protein
MTFYGLLLGVAAAVQAIVVIRAFRISFVEKQVVRLATSLNLGVPDSLEPLVVRQTAYRLRTGAIGGAGGLLVGAIAIAPVASPGYPTVVLVMTSVAIGSTVGTTALSLATLRRDDTSLPRVARARAVTLDDYVHPVARLIMGIVLAVSLIGVAMVTVLSPSSTSVALVLVALAIATFVLAEVGSRQLVDAPQPATTDGELIWSDALRAQLIDDLYRAPVSIAAVGAYLAVQQIFGPQGALVLVIVLVAGIIASSLAISRQHVLRRLWPELVEARR